MNISDKLEELEQSFKSGLISQEEYQTARQQILDAWKNDKDSFLKQEMPSDSDSQKYNTDSYFDTRGQALAVSHRAKTFDESSPKEAITPQIERSRNIYILIGACLGFMGIHNFYALRYPRAIVQLVFSILGVFIPINMVWVLIDMLTVTTDGEEQPMTPLNGWGLLAIIIYTLIVAVLIVGLVFLFKFLAVIFAGIADHSF